MANKLQFDGCLNEQPTVNRIFSGCCQTVTCNVTNVHNTDLNVTNIIGSSTLGYYDANIVEINGSIPSFPFLIPSGDSFEIKIQICAYTGINDDVNIQIITAEHGAENNPFTFGVSYVAPNVSVSSFNFGTVEQFVASSPQPVTITNPSVFDMYFDVNNGTCPNEFSTSVPNPVFVPAGGSVSFNVFWTPTGPAEVIDGCFIDINPLGDPEGSCDTMKLGVLGESTPSTCVDCLCCTNSELASIDSKKGEISIVDNLCLTDEIIGSNAICEEKKLTISYKYVNSISSGLKIWFNPWMFAFTCDFDSFYPSFVNAPPPQGWFIEINSTSMSIGGLYAMNLIGTGPNQFNQTNFEVLFNWISANEFSIVFSFYHIEDVENWIASTALINNPKWRRNSVNAPNPTMGSSFENLIGSVYNTDKKLCSLLYLRDPNNLIDDQPTDCHFVHSINYTARWYNSGLYGGPSEFTGMSSPLPTFELQRTSGVVTDFSTIEPTKIVFKVRIDSGLYGGLEKVIFQLFDETKTIDTVSFLANYDSSRSDIENLAGTGILNNHLIRPSTKTSVSDDHELTAYVNTSVSPVGKYRIAAIVYSSDLVTVNTFISDQIIVRQTPDLTCDECVIDTNSTFFQYAHSENSNCIRPTVKERIRHFVEIDGGSFTSCLENWGGGKFADYLTQITLNVYRSESGFPTPSETTFFMFEQHVSNRMAGFPSGWQNLGNLIVEDDSGIVTTNFLTRVRWENTPFDGSNVMKSSNSTFMNRSFVGFLGSTYVSTLGITNDWTNQTIWFEYVYKFDLSSLFGTPYFINMVKSFQVVPIENEPFSPSHIDSMQIQGQAAGSSTWVDLQNPFCPSDWSRVRVLYTATGLVPATINRFIFFMEPYIGGSISNIMESESFDELNGFPQLNNVLDVSPFFVGNEAFAELDISTLGDGQYIVCGYISLA